MTNEEAIHIMNAIIYMLEPQYDKERVEEAVEMAIKALKQQPCKDCISRDDVDDIAKLMSGYLYDEERTRLKEFSAYLWELPSVTPRTNLAETSRDCISRQAVLDKATSWNTHFTDSERYVSLSDIIALPPVKSNPVFYPLCEDCNTKMDEVRRAYDKLRDLQPCADAVSREEVQDLISRWLSDYLLDETREALETINYKVGDMPSVYPERPKGKWLHIYKSDIACECSVCHIQMPITEYFHYCPNCGANMSGGGEDEET